MCYITTVLQQLLTIYVFWCGDTYIMVSGSGIYNMVSNIE